MSVTYPDLIYTDFPDKVDTLHNFVDITLSSLPLANQYYTLYNSGDIEGAKRILEDNPDLKYSYIGASTLNPIIDSIKAIQLFYTQDVQQYLMNIVKYREDYSSTTKYAKLNAVKYLNNSAIEVFMCIRDDVPIGTLPTNSTYWIPLTMRGEKGEPGLGLTAYGAWNSITTYPANALVSYNNALWGSIIENLNIAPSITATSTWYKIIEFSSELLVFNDKITSVPYKLTINNGMVYFISETNQLDVALKSDIPTSLPANGGNANTVNGKTVESNVPLNAKFTDTVYTHPTTAGNKHIPTGGTVGQILKNTASGTVGWANAPKQTVVNTILSSGGWSGTVAPYTQTLTVSGVTITNNVLFDIGMAVTVAQYNAGMDAMLKATAQTTNSVTIKAFGDKPTINIPVQFIIME